MWKRDINKRVSFIAHVGANSIVVVRIMLFAMGSQRDVMWSFFREYHAPSRQRLMVLMMIRDDDDDENTKGRKSNIGNRVIPFLC